MQESYVAFSGENRIALGSLPEVAVEVKRFIGDDLYAPVLIFQNDTGAQIDLDLRGSLAEVQERHRPAEVRSGPGRPKLGVVPREVTLLPRHWDWLNSQPGGASVALRKLVEEARKTNSKQDEVRQSKEAAYRFISAIAGDLENFQEATRALYAGDANRFGELTLVWPADVRGHALKLAEAAFNLGE